MIAEKITGKKILDFSILDNGLCSMSLSDGYSISAETLCRFVGKDGRFIFSQDYGQMFGLAESYDAEALISKAIKGKEIRELCLSTDTGDMTLLVEDGRLEIICNSAGYECYQIAGPDNLIVVGRGGNQ